MEQGKLYEEQVQYIRENKEKMFAFLKDTKLGFGLNIPVYFSAMAIYELKKQYTVVAKEIDTEKFTVKEFGAIMDAVTVKPEEDYSLKDALKIEVKMSVIASYIRSIYGKTVYPSEIRRKEQALHNTIKRAEECIDEYFKNHDVNYREIADIIDIYELHVRDYGRQVDLHFGHFGLSLCNGATSEDLMQYVTKQRVAYKEKFELVVAGSSRIKELEEIIRKVSQHGDEIKTMLSTLQEELQFSEYAILTKTKEQLQTEMEGKEKNLTRIFEFQEELKHEKVSLPKHARIDVNNLTVSIHKFLFELDKKNAAEFVQEYQNYEKIAEFVSNIEDGLNKDEIRTTARYKDNALQITSRIKDKTRNILEEGRLGLKKPIKKTTMVLNCVDGRLYRPSGEEVLTPDVVLFEMMEKVRNIDKTYLESVQRAKEMLFAVLSESEEKLLLEEDMTFLEGKENYYALLNAQTYNNVVKIPKFMNSPEDIKALCIHPEDSQVPMYDGFAAIALAVKSGDEEYVLENSNEFKLADNLKKKVMKVFDSFIPARNMSMA